STLLSYVAHDDRNIPSFPTRRSSDLAVRGRQFHRRLRRDPRQLRQPARIAVGASVQLRRAPLADPVLGSAGEGEGVRSHVDDRRSEEHTSELQSRENLVCRLLLEKKK